MQLTSCDTHPVALGGVMYFRAIVDTSTCFTELKNFIKIKWAFKNIFTALGVGIAQLVDRPNWRARCSTDIDSSPWCGKGFFSQSQLSVQTLLQCPYSPRVQSHASVSVRMLRISNAGSVVLTHENTAHIDRSSCLCTCSSCAVSG